MLVNIVRAMARGCSFQASLRLVAVARTGVDNTNAPPHRPIPWVPPTLRPGLPKISTIS